MSLSNVSFVISAPNKKSWPNDNLSEVCILGKSNVGKSTFINTLCNNKKLARVSSTPGRTRLLNFFAVGDSFRLVDAPGYGYAKTTLKEDASFASMMEEYIFERDNAVLFILLIDSRHYPSEDDILCYEMLKKANKNILVVATKSDKLNQSLRAKLKKNMAEAFGKDIKYQLVNYNDQKLFKEIENIIAKYV
ncbi:TPA: YihA family ribosome biogenesis GTP-binding protein [bacterium]|nr:YihA family ribosome biogenesis GTP-binding protein [bacterium]